MTYYYKNSGLAYLLYLSWNYKMIYTIIYYIVVIILGGYSIVLSYYDDNYKIV